MCISENPDDLPESNNLGGSFQSEGQCEDTLTCNSSPDQAADQPSGGFIIPDEDCILSPKEHCKLHSSTKEGNTLMHTLNFSDPNEARMQIGVALLEHSGMADVNYIISYV